MDLWVLRSYMEEKYRAMKFTTTLFPTKRMHFLCIPLQELSAGSQTNTQRRKQGQRNNKHTIGVGAFSLRFVV